MRDSAPWCDKVQTMQPARHDREDVAQRQIARAGRKTVGRHTGDILINSHAVERASWSRNLGYVEQHDEHSPQLTVYESLQISAQLRLPRGTTHAALQNHVSTTLQLVRFTPCRSVALSVRPRSSASLHCMSALSSSKTMSSFERALRAFKEPCQGVAATRHIFLPNKSLASDARACRYLVDIMDSLVGTGRSVGLSTEQRKRLTIAVELVANPSAVVMARSLCPSPLWSRSWPAASSSGRGTQMPVQRCRLCVCVASSELLHKGS
jgi:ABC-type glutathione transport system ATPase component